MCFRTGNASVYYGTLDVELNEQVVLDYVVEGNNYPISYEIIELTQNSIILYACNECGFFSDYGKGSEYLYIHQNLLLHTFINSIHDCADETSISIM